jgi:hypothetical protein
VGYSTSDFNFFVKTLELAKASGFKDISYKTNFGATMHQLTKDSLKFVGLKDLT